jgi:hypothetical protein
MEQGGGFLNPLLVLKAINIEFAKYLIDFTRFTKVSALVALV